MPEYVRHSQLVCFGPVLHHGMMHWSESPETSASVMQQQGGINKQDRSGIETKYQMGPNESCRSPGGLGYDLANDEANFL